MAFGAGLLDIVPFVLTMLGVPAGADMPGRPLPDAFEVAPEDSRIPSWETGRGNGKEAAAGDGAEEWASAESLAELAELGYVEQIAPERAQYAALAGVQRDYTLARVHLEAGRHQEAIPLFEAALDFRPEPEIMQALAHCYFSVGRLAEARVLINAVLADNRTRPYALLIRANLELAEGRPGEALVLLAQAEEMEFPSGALQYHIGRAYTAMRRWDDAEKAFARAVEQEPEFTPARRNQARALYELGRNEEAAAAALGAVALRYEDAVSHLILGAALARSRDTERAVQAVETSIRFKPMASAHQLLAQIYDRRGEVQLAAAHRSEAAALHGTV
jgi:tetratricopeptide (TPR) repeat protein